MTKLSPNNPAAPRRTTGRVRPRVPFTPRVTPVAERVDAGGAPLEFALEVEPVACAQQETAHVVRFAPAAPAPPVRVAPRADVRRRAIWLGGAVAAIGVVAWIALRDSDRGTTANTAAASLPAAAAPISPAALTPPPPTVPAPPAATSPPAAKPSMPAGRSERSGAPSRGPTRGSAPPVRRPAAPLASAPPEPAPAPAPVSFHGSLAVHSEPAGARVFVNGTPAGLTPLVLEQVPVGSRVVRIEADGYEAWSSAVRVIADQQSKIEVTLRR
jgi:hypothetical protein